MSVIRPTIPQTIAPTLGAQAGGMPWEASGGGGAPFVAPDAANLKGHWTGESVVLTQSRVSQANDLSGQANHLTQSTAAQRPIVTMRSAGGVPRAAIQFRTANTEWLRIAAFAAAISQPVTVYVLFELTASSPATSIVFDDGGTSEVAHYYTVGSYKVAAGIQLDTGVTTATGVYATCFVANGVSSAAYMNNFTTAKVAANAGPNAMGSLTLGANTTGAGPIDGYVWRVLAYSGAHSQATRNVVRDRLTAYYGNTIA